MTKTSERYANPGVGDTVNLRMFTYNNNNLTELYSIEKVEIFYLDPTEVSVSNPDGRRLIDSFLESDVTIESTGNHLLPVVLTNAKYVIGNYLDIWTIKLAEDEPETSIVNIFDVYPNLIYTTPTPIVYDFKFMFQPNRFRKGANQFIIIEIKPNVPTAGDLRKFYENLAIVSDLKVSIELKCGECVPQEADLRLIVDKESVDYREKRHGYFRLDTSEMECGTYDIWFQLELGENTYISDRQTFQIFD